jgi:acetoin utilization protein AcuC
MSIAVLYRPELKEYDFGPGPPFRGNRYEIFPPFFKARLPQEHPFEFLKADWADDEDLLLISTKEFIAFTRHYYELENTGREHPRGLETYHSADNRPVGRPGKLEEAARLIVGQAKKACDLVHSGRFEKVISIGGGMHHAKPGWGEGFCLYNDVAFAGKYLVEKLGLERVLILDTDAHAGNGTAEYFYKDPGVLFIDIHQDPMTLYPGTGFIHQIGEGRGKGYTINLPLPPHSGDDCYRFVFEEIVLPATREFQPQIIIRNGGSDPHFADTLTHLGLSLNGFQMIGQYVRQMAKFCGGKAIDMIGSGYNPEVLPYAWSAIISGLADFKLPLEERTPIPENITEDSPLDETREMVGKLKTILREYWPGLEKYK